MKLFYLTQRFRLRRLRPMRLVVASIPIAALHTVSALGNDAQAPASKTVETATSMANGSSLDTPATYHYLDWLSPQAIQALPEAQRPILEGVCEGAYLPPQVNTGSEDKPPELQPIEAAADHYEADGDGNITLTGSVIIQQGNRQLESDYIRINQHTRETALEGDVRIRQQGMLMTGEKAELNLNEKSLSLKEAEYVVHESHIRGTATHIYNEDESTLVFAKSSYTTCEPGSNDWLFEASDIRLNQDSGWGTAKHAVVKVKDVPVFYFPWLMFPIDDRRQSGFLFPSFGSGEDNGTQVALPYYFNLAPNYDATLTPRHMTERGTQLEGEFRYLTPYGEGELGGAYLHDSSLDDESRKLAIWKHSGDFYGPWYAKVDYTRVSDNEYFDDLGTTLDAKSKTHLDQEAEVGFNGQDLDLRIKVESFQTLDELIADEDLPYRKLPQVRLTGDSQFNESGFYGIWFSEATRFEHPEDDFTGVTEADRTTLAPGIEYRYQAPWVHVTPRVRLIQSRFDFTSEDDSQDYSENQTLYTASFDTKLFFDRHFQWGEGNYSQTLEPRLFYLYSPYESQNHRQTFDTGRITFDYNQLFRENRFTGGDRFGDANQISLGVTTRVLEDATGWERFRASIGQTFYFDDRRVQLEASDDIERDRRSALVAQAEWQLSEAWNFRSGIQWNETRNNIDRASTSVGYRSEDGALFNASYRYLDEGASTFSNVDKIKQSDISFLWPANNHWSLIGRWGYDLEYNRSFENLVGVEYDSCCWRVRLVNRRYLKENSDDPLTVEAQRGIFLQFQLKGLGGVGNELDDILSDSIRGFQYREQLKTDNY